MLLPCCQVHMRRKVVDKRQKGGCACYARWSGDTPLCGRAQLTGWAAVSVEDGTDVVIWEILARSGDYWCTVGSFAAVVYFTSCGYIPVVVVSGTNGLLSVMWAYWIMPPLDSQRNSVANKHFDKTKAKLLISSHSVIDHWADISHTEWHEARENTLVQEEMHVLLWFACNFTLKKVVYKYDTEYSSALHRHAFSSYMMMMMMCQTQKLNVRFLFILDVEDNSPSLPKKHSVWRRAVFSDVLAHHKSTVKCSVWSPWSSCWNAFVDHTVSCFISQCVFMERRAWGGWRMTSHCQAGGLLLSRSKLSKRTTDILASSVGGGLFGMANGGKLEEWSEEENQGGMWDQSVVIHCKSPGGQ